MGELDNDIEKIAPQKLLDGFTKGKVLLCLIAALLIHVVLIGGTSTDYLYYNVINPKAGEAREAARKAAAEKKKEEERAAALKASAEKAKKDAKGEGTRKSAPNEGKTQSELMEKHKNAPIVKKVTEAAKPNEIPKEPDGIGISIEDTNF